LCGSKIIIRSFGIMARDFFRSRLTEVVLPTPVDPKTAKCRRSNVWFKEKVQQAQGVHGKLSGVGSAVVTLS
jgi:hypothetical protein